MNKLSAFTVIEMVLALLLCGIIISLSYGGLLLSGQRVHRFEHQAKAITELITMKKCLYQDVESSCAIHTSYQGFECMSSKDSIKYLFVDSLLLRQRLGHSDTLCKQLVDVLMYYDQLLVSSENAPLDAIDIRYIFQGKLNTFHIDKAFTAAERIALEQTSTPTNE